MRNLTKRAPKPKTAAIKAPFDDQLAVLERINKLENAPERLELRPDVGETSPEDQA